MKEVSGYLVGPASELREFLDPAAGQAVEFEEEDVPEQFHSLIPLTRVWGIGDDSLRDLHVAQATPEERRELAAAINPFVSDLTNWLGGDAAQTMVQNGAYQALSCLSYAADLADIIEAQVES